MSASECVAQARAAEAAGMFGVWFAENPFARGILPAAAACAVATHTLRIGAGVFNPYMRHPLQIAMDASALDELSGGRARLGLGSGIGSAIEQIGFAYDRPLTTLREAAAIVRALLNGETVTYVGSVFTLRDVQLSFRPRADMPIYMAGRGPQSVVACGEVADGLIVSNMCTAAFAARTAETLRAAASAAGRSACPEIVQYVPCVPRADRVEAYAIAKRAIAEMLPAFWALGQRLPAARDAMLDGGAIGEAEFAAAYARLCAGEKPENVLDDRFVAAFAIAGDAEDCRKQVAAYGAAGVTELALTFSARRADEDMRTLARAISA